MKDIIKIYIYSILLFIAGILLYDFISDFIEGNTSISGISLILISLTTTIVILELPIRVFQTIKKLFSETR